MLIRILKIFGLVVSLVLAALAGAYLYLAALDGKRAKPLALRGADGSRPLFFAHRGGASEAPENTIPAFEKAAESGADVLELDVHLSADDELVVFHDRSLDRTTDRKGLISELKLSDLKAVDAGYRYTEDGGKTFPYRNKGIAIPTLRQVFERFPDELINIEVKTYDPKASRPLCNLVREFRRERLVIVASAAGEVLKEFRSQCAEVATSASFDEIVWFMFLYNLGLTNSFSAEMEAFQIPEEMFSSGKISRQFISAVKERNIEVHVWTKNKKEDIRRLLDSGVDGVMTDRPSLIVGFAK